MGLNIRQKYNGQGIYAIVNIYDFKIYIGSSDNIRTRGKNHESTLKAGRHPNKELQKDYNNNKILDKKYHGLTGLKISYAYRERKRKKDQEKTK